MSLVCYECGVDVQPTKTFPGREGGLVSPIVRSAVWVPGSHEDKEWVITFLKQGSWNRVLCFECIETKMSAPMMKIIYDAYRAEIQYRRTEKKINDSSEVESDLRSIYGTLQRVF